MSGKPSSKANLAADVETKRIDIPDIAKGEILRMQHNLNTYLAGIVAGLGIKGHWSFDIQRMQIVVGKK